jgi:16S rRNA G966 N2-methylase RsmD
MTTVADYWKMYKARGVKRIIYEVWENALYDMIHGVDTQTYKPLNQYPVSLSQIIKNSVQYQPTYTSVIRHTIAKTAEFINRPVSFVDLGSGKGKVMLEAMRFNFTMVHGVEIDPELVGIAENNIKIMYPASLNYTLHLMDIGQYLFPQDLGIIFLFNPCDEVVLGEIIKNIDLQYQKYQKDIFIIYVNPIYLGLFEKCDIMYKQSKYMQDSVILRWGS